MCSEYDIPNTPSSLRVCVTYTKPINTAERSRTLSAVCRYYTIILYGVLALSPRAKTHILFHPKISKYIDYYTHYLTSKNSLTRTCVVKTDERFNGLLEWVSC